MKTFEQHYLEDVRRDETQPVGRQIVWDLGKMTAAEMIAEHTGRIEWAEFHASSDVSVRSAILETATRKREGLL